MLSCYQGSSKIDAMVHVITYFW